MIYHVIPEDDIKEHEIKSTCNCNPQVKREGDEFIIIHNSYDGREGVEWVNELLETKK